MKNGRFEFEDHFGETETLTVHVLQPGETRFTLDRSRAPDAAVTLRDERAFRPGRPVPTHRLTDDPTPTAVASTPAGAALAS